MHTTPSTRFRDPLPNFSSREPHVHLTVRLDYFSDILGNLVMSASLGWICRGERLQLFVT